MLDFLNNAGMAAQLLVGVNIAAGVMFGLILMVDKLMDGKILSFNAK